MITSSIRKIGTGPILILLISIFIFLSCHSSRYTAGNHARHKRTYPKITGKQYRTISQKKVKAGSVKCHHINTLIVDQESQRKGTSEKTDEKTDFTLIILSAPHKAYPPDTAHNKHTADKVPSRVR
jgi:hypothetical protein